MKTTAGPPNESNPTKESTMSVKDKDCKVCGTPYPQFNSTVKWCSVDCGVKLAAIIQQKKYKKKTAQMKKDWRDNDRSYQLKKAQAKCNEYIRLRDNGLPCISCGTTNNIQYAAGHYKTIGSHPELRFHPYNINRQCNKNCNVEQSGNAINYRRGLIEKIGLVNVEWLEGPHKPQNLTLDDIKEVTLWYKEQINHHLKWIG